MKNQLKHLTLTLGIAAFSLPLFAQLSIGGGLAYGTEIENIGLTAKGAYLINDQWEGAASFTIFLSKNNFDYWEINFDGHYLKEASEKMTIYPLAGLNISTVSFNLETGLPGFDDNFSSTKVGLNVGGGARLSISESLSGYAEIKYVISDFDQLVINAGVLFAIGN